MATERDAKPMPSERLGARSRLETLEAVTWSDLDPRARGGEWTPRITSFWGYQ